MFESGCVYRDNRLVNWDARLRTAVSDIEVDYIDIPGRTLINVPGYEQVGVAARCKQHQHGLHIWLCPVTCSCNDAFQPQLHLSSDRWSCVVKDWYVCSQVLLCACGDFCCCARVVAVPPCSLWSSVC